VLHIENQLYQSIVFFSESGSSSSQIWG